MRLSVQLREHNHLFSVTFNNPFHHFGTILDDVQTVTEYVGGEVYNGDYVITPKVEMQTMPTKEKIMLEDVTINAIPYAEVSNNSGGQTITIG